MKFAATIRAVAAAALAATDPLAVAASALLQRVLPTPLHSRSSCSAPSSMVLDWPAARSQRAAAAASS